MKKSLKILALGLAVLPSMLFLASCGKKEEDRSIVNTSGKYTAVENSQIGEINEFLGDKIYENISGIKNRVLITMTYEDMKVTSEVIATYTNLDKLGTEEFGMSYIAYQNNKKIGTMYVQNNMLYSSVDKTYTEFNVGSTSDDAVISPTEIDLSNLFMDYTDTQLTDAQIKVYSKGDTYKINYINNDDTLDETLQNVLESMSATNVTSNPTNMYLVFDQNEFVGMSSEVNLTCNISGYNYKVNAIVETVLFDGEIEYPDFTGYLPAV